MSLATPSIVDGSSIAAPAPGRSSITHGGSINGICNASARSVETVTMDRQPQAPRRSISPVQRRPTERSETIKVDNTNKSCDSDDNNYTIDEDLEYISQLYGNDDIADSIREAESLEFGMAGPGQDIFFDMPPTPPLRHINEYEQDGSPYRLFGKKKHEYDRTRQPEKSSMRKPNSKNRNIHSIDNSLHNKKDVSRGISRNHSADGTEDTRRGSGRLHSVRMRGSIYPVHRRQSIAFEETVCVKEVTPTVELNDGNTRELWLQHDEAMEIKERRRGLLRRYKEREARKKKEAERIQREREKVQRQQKVKNLLTSSKNNFVLHPASPKKQTRLSGLLKRLDAPLPGVSASGRRWKAEHPSVMGLSVPSRGGDDRSSSHSLSMGDPTTSFLSVSSGGSSFSGNDSDSFRGLEKYIDRSGKHQKNMVWDAVFMEQDEQLQFGYYDDERIANLYQTVQNQHDGQQKAMGRARKDRKAANNYLMTPRTLKLLKKTINVRDVNSIACGNLLEDDSDIEKDADKDTDEDADKGVTGDNNGHGNYGKTDSKDDNDTNDETRASSRGIATGSTTTLNSSGDSKMYNKFLRRLSV